jgi:diaminohydroxyphosphoribosylaminopyrimidine deaminase/5-amino-6-(5-phosphoribosylamino)uracil reductase
MDLVDEFVGYLAPNLLGGEKLAIGSIDVPSIDQAKGLAFQEVRKLGEDVLIVATPVREN